MNRTIKLLMLSDIFLITGFGLIDPILAIFLKENLIGGTIFAAGIASTLFLITKSVVQLPFSRYVDKHDHKVRWLIVGTLIITTIPFLYIFLNDIKYIYLVQMLHGIGSGLAYPTWLGLWSTNLDRKHESFEWSLYSTLSGIGTSITGIVGAAIAEYLGFKFTFALVGFMSLLGSLILLGLEKKKEKLKTTTLKHYHTKRKLVNRKNH